MVDTYQVCYTSLQFYEKKKNPFKIWHCKDYILSWSELHFLFYPKINIQQVIQLILDVLSCWLAQYNKKEK